MKLITHYTKISTLVNYILEYSQFLMNILPNTKDPYEYKKRFPMVISKLNLVDELKEAPFIVDDVLNLQTKIGCFVKEDGNLDEIHTLSSITNSAMWAHYGDNHEGVVLIFELDEFIKACKGRIEYDWALRHDEINYDFSTRNNPERFTLDETNDCSNLGISKYVFNRCCEYWFYKSKEWSYENEYRIMLYSSDKGAIKIDFRNALKAIVFGDKTSNVTKNYLGNYCKEKGYKTLSVEFNSNENRYKKSFI